MAFGWNFGSLCFLSKCGCLGYDITDAPFPDVASASEERGGPFRDIGLAAESLLEEQPLVLLLKLFHEPRSQPGSLGGTSIGVGAVILHASAVSAQVMMEPITTPDDAAVIA